MKTFLLSILPLALIAQCYPCVAQNCPSGPDGGPFYCSHEINPLPEAPLPFLGRKVSIDANLSVIGMHGAGNSPVLVVDCNTGDVVLELADPVPTAAHGFGYSVKILDDLIVVGDQNHMYLDSSSRLGQVYLYKIDRQVIASGGDGIVDQFVIDDPTASFASAVGRFGHDVGVSENFVVVGEPDQLQFANGGLASNAGAAYLFSVDNQAVVRALSDPSPNANDMFGSYVAIEEFEEDTFIAVSDIRNDDDGSNSGKVFLYGPDSSQPIQSFPNGTEGDLFFGGRDGTFFGQDTDIDQGRLLVTFTGGAVCYDLTAPGSPAIFVFDHEVDSATPIYRSQTCAIDNNHVIIGAPIQYIGEETGKIFVYDLQNAPAGLEQFPVQTISDPTTNPFVVPEEWPVSVAIDDQNIAAGSPIDLGPNLQIYSGQANLFRSPLLGDVNFDGIVDPLDVAGFVSHVLTNEYLLEADINLDLSVDDDDIQPFLDLLN